VTIAMYLSDAPPEEALRIVTRNKISARTRWRTVSDSR
jgi:hypothetical protein